MPVWFIAKISAGGGDKVGVCVRSGAGAVGISLGVVEAATSDSVESGAGSKTPFASVAGGRVFDTLSVVIEASISVPGIDIEADVAVFVGTGFAPSAPPAMNSAAGVGVGVGDFDGGGGGVGDFDGGGGGVGDGVGVGVGACSGAGVDRVVFSADSFFALITFLEDARAALRLDFDLSDRFPTRRSSAAVALDFRVALGSAFPSALVSPVLLSSAFASAFARAFVAFSFALVSALRSFVDDDKELSRTGINPGRSV